MRNIAGLYRDTGRYKQSGRLSARALDIAKRVFGDTHRLTLLLMEELALTYRSEEKYAEAEALYAKLLKLEATVLGREHPNRLATMNDFALAYLDQREYVKAESLVRAALDSYGKTTMDTWFRYNSESLLGASLVGQKKYVQAEPVLLSGYAGMVRLQGFIPAGNRFNLKSAQQRIVQLYVGWGRQESANQWREKLYLTRTAGVSHNAR